MRDDCKSEISHVSIGFGAYRTRNYNHFEQANLNQMVTRNQFSQIVSNRPQIMQVSTSFLEKMHYDVQQRMARAPYG